MAQIPPLTERKAVLQALDEYDRVGQSAFLDRYGFGVARWWRIQFEGRQYDSKAIYGAAIGYEHGKPLTAKDFKGGEGTVVRVLRSLGFVVSRQEITETSTKLPEEVAQTFPEGMRTVVTVNSAERSSKARRECVAYHGFACVVCGMDFERVYGVEFSGLIHVHHLTPLSQLSEGAHVNPKVDLVPVCPNCHAAIHFNGQTRSPDDIRLAIAKLGRDPPNRRS